MKKATRQDTREHNRNLVLKTIFDRTSISRAEIARVTSLTRTTVSDIVAGLLEEELVSEIGVGSSLGGKNPVLLGIVEDSRYLIGLDLARNQFRGAIVNLRGKIRETVTLSVNSKNGDEALALVYEILDKLVEPHTSRWAEQVALPVFGEVARDGFGTGTINQGVINHAPTLGEMVRAYKAASTRLIRQAGTPDFAWQRNYYEHVVRDEESLDRIRQYILNPPQPRRIRETEDLQSWRSPFQKFKNWVMNKLVHMGAESG